MILHLSSNDLKKLKTLIKQKEKNIETADFLNALCFSSYSFSKEFSKEISEAKIHHVLLDEIDYQHDYKGTILKETIPGSFVIDNPNKYRDNPYYKNIHTFNDSKNKISLNTLKYDAYTFFPLDDITIDKSSYFKEQSTIGIFKETYEYLALVDNKNIWMCITPNEMNTMSSHIDAANGNVITFGLGLGYYAYMCSLKQNVKHITIIEKDDNIINLFLTHILPQFEYKEKIEVIHMDAFDFMKENYLSEYNYAFFDLWHNAEDGLPIYLKAKRFKCKCKTGYWIETSIKALYGRCFITLLEENLLGYKENQYKKANNEIDKIINDLYFLTQNKEFNSYKEIENFIFNTLFA